jgi:hypothetical protein
MPKTKLAQRFIESFKVRDRKAIANGTNIMIAVGNTSSDAICMPVRSKKHYRHVNQECHYPEKPQN